LERAIVDAAAAKTFNAALEIGYRAFGASACTAAAREGIDAFLSRRAADFTKTG
jgi:enoyl-CoA hydratase/3-hydroxyacyl-CoA dehydrogenase